MEYAVYIEGRTFRVRVEGRTLGVRDEAGERVLQVDLAADDGAPVRSVRIGGRSRRVVPVRNGRGAWSLVVDGLAYEAEVLDPADEAVRRAGRKAAAVSGPAPLRAPMPGLVVRIEVVVGDDVVEGDGVVVVEAMKMENELRAAGPGRVAKVLAKEGTTVEKDQVLVEFEPPEEAS